jgi:hypothetical protein
MKTFDELDKEQKEHLLDLYARILANFPEHAHIDPRSMNFNEKLLEGARFLAPHIYNL